MSDERTLWLCVGGHMLFGRMTTYGPLNYAVDERRGPAPGAEANSKRTEEDSGHLEEKEEKPMGKQPAGSEWAGESDRDPERDAVDDHPYDDGGSSKEDPPSSSDTCYPPPDADSPASLYGEDGGDQPPGPQKE